MKNRQLVRYSLFQIVYRGKRRFYLSLRFKEDMSLVELLTDEEQAHFVFKTIRRGGVTPCTLVEVLGDMLPDGFRIQKQKIV